MKNGRTSSPRRVLLLTLAVSLLSASVYLGTLRGAFVYDDIIYIKNNPQIAHPGDCFATPFPAYMGPRRGLYRPMTTLSLALDHRLFGPGPFGFHLGNVLLHGLCAGLCFLVLRRLLDGELGPAAGALLFGLHPVHAEAVAWAVGRSELLAALGGLAALYAYLEAVRQRGRLRAAWLLGAVAAFLFAGLSKENALALPGAFAAYELTLRRADKWRQRLLRIAPFAAAVGFLLVLRFLVLGALGPGEGQQVLAIVHYPERFLLALRVLSQYVILALFPFELKPHYQPIAFKDPSLLACLPGLLLLAWTAWLVLRKRTAALGPLLFAVLLVPVLNLVPIGEVVAERFLYLPLLGACLLFGRGAASLARAAGALPAAGLAGAVLAAAGVLAARQAAVWHDHRTLWTHAVAVDPEDPQARLGLATVLIKEGRIEGADGALHQLQQAKALNPRYKPELVAFHEGRALEALGRYAEALRAYREALSKNPFLSFALEAVLRLDRAVREKGGAPLLAPEERDRFLRRRLRMEPDPHRRAVLQEEFRG